MGPRSCGWWELLVSETNTRRAGLSVAGIWKTGVRGRPRLKPVPEFADFVVYLVWESGASSINIRRAGVRGGLTSEEDLDELASSLTGLPVSVDLPLGVVGKLSDGTAEDADMDSLEMSGFGLWAYLSGDVTTKRSNVREETDGDWRVWQREFAARSRTSGSNGLLASSKALSTAWAVTTENGSLDDSPDLVS